MRVLFLTRLFHPHVGGVELHVAKLSQQLRRHGHQISLITTQHQPEIPLWENYQGIQITRIPYGVEPDKFALWNWIGQHQSLLNSADVIHAHDVYWWIWPWRYRYNPYTTFHGYEGVNQPGWTSKLHRKIIDINTPASICVGEFMRRWYWAKPEKIIYGATDPVTSIWTPAKQLHPPLKAIYLGRLAEDAGILAYLKLVQRLKAEKLAITLDVYGDGPDAYTAQAYAQKENLSVNFFGFVPEAYQLLSDYNLAFVSRYLAIIEAMAYGRLVVAHHNNQIKQDYLECHPQADQMIQFRSSDTALAGIVTMLTQPQLYQQTINQAKAWARQHTWEQLAYQYQELWRS